MPVSLGETHARRRDDDRTVQQDWVGRDRIRKPRVVQGGVDEARFRAARALLAQETAIVMPACRASSRNMARLGGVFSSSTGCRPIPAFRISAKVFLDVPQAVL